MIGAGLGGILTWAWNGIDGDGSQLNRVEPSWTELNRVESSWIELQRNVLGRLNCIAELNVWMDRRKSSVVSKRHFVTDCHHFPIFYTRAWRGRIWLTQSVKYNWNSIVISYLKRRLEWGAVAMGRIDGVSERSFVLNGFLASNLRFNQSIQMLTRPRMFDPKWRIPKKLEIAIGPGPKLRPTINSDRERERERKCAFQCLGRRFCSESFRNVEILYKSMVRKIPNNSISKYKCEKSKNESMKTAFEKHTKATRREKGRTLRERTYWSLIISTCVHQQMQIRFSLYFSIDSFFLSFFFLLFSLFFSSFPFLLLLLLLLPLLPRLLCLFPQPPPPSPPTVLPPSSTTNREKEAAKPKVCRYLLLTLFSSWPFRQCLIRFRPQMLLASRKMLRKIKTWKRKNNNPLPQKRKMDEEDLPLRRPDCTIRWIPRII